MVALAPDAILVLDQKRHIRLWNEKAVALSGLPADQSMGRLLPNLGWLAEASLAELNEHLQGRTKQSSASAPFELETSDGQCTLEANVGAISAVGELEWL
jgi:PAS domain S-box-containing protein